MHEDAVHNNIKHHCYLHVNETDPEGDRHDELPGSEEPNDLDRLNKLELLKSLFMFSETQLLLNFREMLLE